MSAMPMPQAPDNNRGIYSNEYIEQCAQRYIDAGIGIRGVTFEQYIALPHRYDNGDRSLDPLPLNGAQRRVQRKLIDDELNGRVERMEREVQELPKRNGRFVEPLRHHRFPKSIADFIPQTDKPVRSRKL